MLGFYIISCPAISSGLQWTVFPHQFNVTMCDTAFPVTRKGKTSDAIFSLRMQRFIIELKPNLNYIAVYVLNTKSHRHISLGVLLQALDSLKRFGTTSLYWSADKWILLCWQIRVKGLAVMEQTCPQPLHSGALCQSYGLLGLHKQFRHHLILPIQRNRQTCRCPQIHLDCYPVQADGCRLFTCDLSFHCHLSVGANKTQHIRDRRPAGHHSAKLVKHPTECQSMTASRRS